MEAQLAELTPQLAGVWLVEMDSLLFEKVDVAGCGSEIGLVEALQPVGDLVLKRDFSPRHTINGICRLPHVSITSRLEAR